MTMRTVFATAVALVLAQGCSVLEVREISRAALESPSPETLDKEGYVGLPGVRVAAAARNDRVATTLIGPGHLPIFPIPVGGPVESSPHFWIDLAIEPEGESFTFDPNQVRLHMEPGSSLAPSLATGPAEVLQGLDRRYSQRLCGFDPTAAGGVITAVPVRELSCFSLRFEIAPPGHDARFTLSIGGLANAGHTVAVPTILFAKGHAWSLRALP